MIVYDLSRTFNSADGNFRDLRVKCKELGYATTNGVSNCGQMLLPSLGIGDHVRNVKSV